MSEVIDRAIEVLREKGWVRGSLYDPITGRFCLNGALGVATGLLDADNHHLGGLTHPDEWARRTAAFHDAQQAIVAHVGTTVPHWNDHKARDVDEVIEVLKLAGERLDLQQEGR